MCNVQASGDCQPNGIRDCSSPTSSWTQPSISTTTHPTPKTWSTSSLSFSMMIMIMNMITLSTTYYDDQAAQGVGGQEATLGWGPDT